MGKVRWEVLLFAIQVLIVSVGHTQDQDEFSLRPKAYARASSILVSTDNSTASAEAELFHYLNDPAVSSYKRLSEGVYSVSSRDMDMLDSLKARLRALGFNVELNQMIGFQAGGLVNDPDVVAAQYFGPTELARNSPTSGVTAFDYTLGTPSVVIGVVDTPLDAYESSLVPFELASPILSGTGGAPWFSHGTQVSYVIHGQPNGHYSFGVCPNCSRIFSGLSLDPSSVSPSSLIDGALSAVNSMANLSFYPPDIINLSWGAPLESPAMARVFKDAYDRGVTVVSAAGNSGLPSPIYPASSPHVIGVGSSGGYQQITPTTLTFSPNIISPFSNRGADIVAPGSNLRLPDASSPVPVMKYMDGTSFASPYVAGSLGLVESYYKQRHTQFQFLQQMSRFARARYFENLLLSTANDLGAAGTDQIFGAGLVNPRRAIAALIEDGKAESNPLAPGLTRGIVEWGTTRRVIDIAQTRIQQGNPSTEMIVNLGPFQVGGCWDPAYGYTKIKVSRPRFAIGVSGASLSVVSAVGNELELEYSSNVSYTGYLRVKVFSPLQCLLGLPGTENTINFSMSPSGSSAAFQRYRFKYLLGTKGYELSSVSQDVEHLEFKIDVSHMPQVLDSELSRLTRSLAKDISSLVNDLLAAPMRAQAGAMVDKILSASLSQERITPFNFYDWKRGGAGRSMSVKLFEGYNSANHSGQRNETISSIRAVRPTGAVIVAPLAPSQPVVIATTGASSGESEVVSHVNIINAQLAQLFGDSAFNYVSEPQVANAGTDAAPGGVAFYFSNVKTVSAPKVKPSPLGDTGLHIEAEFSADLVVNGISTGSTIIYQVPLSRASMYKGRLVETSGRLDPAYYEDRVVPDVTESKVIVKLHSQMAQSAILPVATEHEIGMLFHYLYGLKAIRKFSALSLSANHLNVMLGDFWGCFTDVIETVNYAYRLMTEAQGLGAQELLIPGEVSGCYDLNIGYFAPQHSPDIVQGSEQRRSFISFFERDAVKEPMTDHSTIPAAGLEIRQFPNGIGQGYRVVASISPQPLSSQDSEPAGEVQTSMNGLYRTPFVGEFGGVKRREVVSIVQHLWQLGGSLGTRERPNILMPNGGAAAEFNVVGIGRNLKELNRQDSCLPYVRVVFPYHLGSNVPPIVTYGHGGAFEERPVTAQNDGFAVGNCSSNPWPALLPIKGSASEPGEGGSGDYRAGDTQDASR